MKSQIKLLLLSTVSILTLCCTLSHASNYVSTNIKSKTDNINTLTIVSTDNQHQPIFSMVLSSNTEFTPKKINKKNEFFELAAVFNDKLQSLISSIHSSTTYSQKLAESSAEKQKNNNAQAREYNCDLSRN